MTDRIRKRNIGLTMAAGVVLGATAAGAGSAEAATPGATPSLRVVAQAAGIDKIILVKGDDIVGYFEWSQDPNGSNPGDAMRVTDSYADGAAVEADLGSRIATTAGHASPYTSKWNTGDLPERHFYVVSIFLVKGGGYARIGDVKVES